MGKILLSSYVFSLYRKPVLWSFYRIQIFVVIYSCEQYNNVLLFIHFLFPIKIYYKNVVLMIFVHLDPWAD